MKNPTDLIDSSETTLRLVKSWIKDSTNNVTLFEPDLSMNPTILSNYQVTTKVSAGNNHLLYRWPVDRRWLVTIIGV